MTFGLARRCVGILSPAVQKSSGLSSPSVTILARSIYTMEEADPNWKRPPPFDYVNREYNHFWSSLDDCTHRYDDNTKLIVVDGPPTGNKGVVAKALADAFGMIYMEPCHLDSYYFDRYGRDRRSYNYKLPPKMRSWDVHQFNERPDGFLSSRMQWIFFYQRFLQYADVFNHILSTGQGAVMHRSVYSDFVFGKTMADMGFIPRPAYDHIEAAKKNGMFKCNAPHLVVYLDMSPETIIKNAALRNTNNEVGSPFFSVECLTQLNKNYKLFLDKIGEESDVLVYDWNEEVCVEDIIDDICDIDFSMKSKYDLKHYSWNWLWYEEDWKKKRIAFNRDFHRMLAWIKNTRMPHEIKELLIEPNDYIDFYEATDNEPGTKYQYGYNWDMGDRPWFKVRETEHRQMWRFKPKDWRPVT